MSKRNIAGFGMIALGAAIAISAVLGPLILGAIRFRTSANIENQFVGSEIVSLGIVAPVAVASGVLLVKGSRIAPALALGPTLYSIYTYSSAILGQEYNRYEGNVESFFPLYATIVAGSGALAATAWSMLSQSDIPTPAPRLRRSLATILVAGGTLIGLAWTAQIRLVLTGHPPTEYIEGPTVFWVIKLFDLGFVVPAAIAVGIGLLRGHPASIKAAFGLSGFLTCMAGAVAGMAIAMELKGDPSSQPMIIVILLPITAGLAMAKISLLRTIDRTRISSPAVHGKRPAARSVRIPA
jgi:hypothetical protein